MKVHVLEQSQFLPISMEEAWEFFATPRNLDKIIPDDFGFSILHVSGEKMHPGQIITYKVKVPPGVTISWVTEITHVDEGKSFVDDQRFGPYKFWHHKHSFEPTEGGIIMHDLVHYALPFSPFGEIAHGLFVKPQLKKIFDSRRSMLDDYFQKKP